MDIRRHFSTVPVAFAVMAAAFVLDLLTPPELEWAEIYLVAVAIMAWAVGWRRGIVFAAIAALVAMAVDIGAFKPVEPRPSAFAVVLNALSEFLVYAAAVVVSDRAQRGRESQQAENRDQARLLRVLEREFLRPLRAVYWFALKFEDTMGPEVALPDRMTEQLASLRHNVRQMNFLASDLIRIGRLSHDELLLTRDRVDLKRLAADVVNEVLDPQRVVFSASPDTLIVRADAASLHHAISSVIGRLLDAAPVHDAIYVFARRSGNDAVVEFTSRGDALPSEEFELADLLTQANGGRLVVVPRGPAQGVRVNLHVPQVAAPAVTPLLSPSGA